jgi:hypothetical protein
MKSCRAAVERKSHWIRERFGFSATVADDFQSGSDNIDQGGKLGVRSNGTIQNSAW